MKNANGKTTYDGRCANDKKHPDDALFWHFNA
jgi:hypothetical protein